MAAPQSQPSGARAWIKRHPFRFAVYALIVLALGAAAIGVPRWSCRSNGLLKRWADLRALHQAAEQIGIRYSVGSARACFGASWRTALEGLDVQFSRQPLLVHTSRIELSARGVSIDEVAVGTLAQPNLITIHHTQGDIFFRSLETRQVRVLFGAAATDSHLSAESISVTGVSLSRSSNGTLRIGQALVEDVRTVVQPGPGGAWNLDGLKSLQNLLDSLSNRPLVSLQALYEALARFRALLFWVLVGTAVLLVVLKLVAVRRLQLNPLRLFVVAVAATLPIVCYALLFRHLSIISFVLLSLLASLLLALLLELTTYRSGGEWHQRWEPFAIDLIASFTLLPLLVVYGLTPTRPASAPSIEIAEASVRNVHATVRDPGISGGPLASLALPEIHSEGLTVGVDPLSAELRSISLGRASFRGALIGSLPSKLTDIRWLPRSWFTPRETVLCGTLHDSALREPAQGLTECGEGSTGFPFIAVDVAARLGLAPLRADYTVETHVRMAGLDAGIDAEGTQHAIQVQRVESLPDSKLEIGGGSGSIAWSGGLTTGFTLRHVQIPDFVRLQSAETRLAVPSLTQPASFDAGLTLRDATVLTERGKATFARCRLSLHQADRADRRPLSMESMVEGIRLSGRRPGNVTDWLTAEFPLLKLKLTGQSKGAPIPESFEGEARVEVGGPPGKTVFGTDRPFRFRADVRQGTFEVTEQPLVVRQSIFPQAPDSVAIRLGASGQVLSLGAPFKARTQAHCHIPQLVPDMLPVRTEISDLDIRSTTAFDADRVSSQLRYSSEWSTVTLPALPRALELKSVPFLGAETDGAVPRLPSAGQLFDILGPALAKLRSLPASVPARFTFKIEGAWPPEPGGSVFQAQTPSGVGVRVGSVVLDVGKFLVSQARFEQLDARVEASGIQTIDGRGDLELRAGVSAAKDAVDVTASLPLGPNLDALAFQVHRTPADVDFRLTHTLASGSLVAKLEPFLKDRGLRLDGITPKAEIRQFAAVMRFSGTSMTGIDLRAQLAPGPLVGLDFDKLLPGRPAPFLKQADLSVDGQKATDVLWVKVTSSAGDRGAVPVEILVGSPPVSVQALDTQHQEYHARVSLRSRLSAVLYTDGGPPPKLILQRLSDAASGLAHNLESAFRALGPSPPQKVTGFRDITWRATVRDRSPDVPAVSLDSTHCHVALSLGVQQFAWSAAPGHERSRIASDADLRSDFRVEGDDLIAEGEAPLDVHLALAGQAPRHIKAHLPFAILIARQLRAAPPGSDLLWDQASYDAFWEAHPPRYATGETAILDARQVELGPLSIEQVAIPSRAFRMALGYGQGLDLDVPLSSRALYGSVGGAFQARLRWSGDAVPLVDTRLNLQLRNLQAAAFGLASPEGHTPIVEDQLDGTIRFHADRLVLDRRVLSRLATGSFASTELDKLNLSARLWSSATDHEGRGTIQGMTAVRLNFMNAVLNQLARELRLDLPPRVLRYDSLRLDFEAADGKIVPKQSVVELRGMKLFSTAGLQIDGTLRVHLGTPSQEYPLQSLSFLAQRFLSADVFDWPRAASSGFRVSLRRNP